MGWLIAKSSGLTCSLNVCLKHTLWRDMTTSTRSGRQSRKNFQVCCAAANDFWLLLGLLLCTPQLCMSSDGLQQYMHLPHYHENQHMSRSALDMSFPPRLEPLKILRTFRALSKTTKETSENSAEVSGMLHQSQQQKLESSISQQAVSGDIIHRGEMSNLPDKEPGKASSTSEGDKGDLEFEDVSICKRFPPGKLIRTAATSGGAIQANIQSLKVLFSQDAAFDTLQAFLQQSHMTETHSLHPPNVVIEPSFLEWGKRPLYSPGIISLTIINTCSTTFLKVFQLYSTSVQFYSNSFQESILSPGEKLEITITYLPRILGEAEAIIALITSAGSFLLHAQGFGIASPYNLPPQLTVSVEKGKTANQNLTLYNPYEKELVVREIQAWPVDPVYRNFYLCCGSRVMGNTCGKNANMSRTSCLAAPDSPNNNCDSRFYEAQTAHMSYAPTIEIKTSIKLRPLETWQIEAHQSSQITAIEVVLHSNESWTAVFCIRLATDNSGTDDDIIILPMDILLQQRAIEISQFQLESQVQDFQMLKESIQAFHAQNTQNGTVQVEELHKDLIASNKSVSSWEDENTCLSGTNATRDSCEPEDVDGIMHKEVDYGVYQPLAEREFTKHSTITSISIGAVSYQAKMQRQFFKCPQLCLHSGRYFEFCQTYEKLMHSHSCSNVPISSMKDVEKKRKFQDYFKVTMFWELSKLSWDRGLPTLITQMGIPRLSGAFFQFSTVQVGREEMRYIRIRNPNPWPVSSQLLLYPRAEAVDCMCVYRDAFDACVSEQSDQSIEFTGDISAGSTTNEKKLHRNIFSIPKESVSYATLEAHGETFLGPILFRPPSSCIWSGIVIISNNVSGMEWLPLQGTGGFAHLTLCHNDVPVQSLFLPSNASNILALRSKESPERVVSRQQAISGKKFHRFHVLIANNTGNVLLEVYSIEIVYSSYNAKAFDVHGPQQSSLKPGQSTELFIYYHLEPVAAANNVYLHILTSIGRFEFLMVVSVPDSPLSSDVFMVPYAKYETVIFQFTVFASILVLIIFAWLLVKERSQRDSSKPVSPKSNAQMSMKQDTNLACTHSSSDIPLSSTNKATSFDHSTKKSPQPVFQFKIAEDTRGSGSSKQKESLLNSRSVKGLIAVASPLAVITGSAFSSVQCEPNFVTTPKISTVQVKAGIESAPSFVRSTKERASTTARRGAEKLKNAGPSENQQASLLAQPPSKGGSELQTKEMSSLTPKSRHGHSKSTSLGYKPSESPRSREIATQELTINTQPHFSDPGADNRSEKDKGKRKVRLSNLGLPKQEERSKSRSGSSSSASSPTSPATPVTPSRSVSPLFYSESIATSARERSSSTFKTSKGAQPGSRLQSRHNASNFSHSSIHSHGSKELSSRLAFSHEVSLKQDLAQAEKWWPSLADTVIQSVQKEREQEFHTADENLRSSINCKKVLSSSIAPTEADRQGVPLSYARDPQIVSQKDKAGPSLTSSATFPRGAGTDGQTVSAVLGKTIGNPYQVTSSLVNPSARAPGSKLFKGHQQHVPAGIVKHVQQCEKLCSGSWVGCDFQDNCSCCGRASVDGSECSSKFDGEPEQGSSNLEYDIWGNHFANISRHYQHQCRFTRPMNRTNGTVNASSLFSESLQLMLREDVKSEVVKSNSFSEYSMFTGNSFADISFSKLSPKINLPSAEDVTFASVENLKPRSYVNSQRRNTWKELFC
ncbi:hypothetical protein O6H91_04G051500 [Diphasiastrum complanatum]|uniref:Uncharacterized protein n=3 Tax=Diphasiastrum complanatum TaxID=34168 RepID=A0ACC2DWJ8_DIPCM|nr:hypothetical protein O6H91_04G051500 [Diphasiastrum complanatum]